jgi:hypothetical protein
MKRVVLSIFVWGMIAAPLLGQSSPPTIYAESFRHGPTQVTEDTFDVKLTPQNPSYKERMKDSEGKDRYELTITPQIPGGDDKITSWAVTLRDLRHSIYGNLLMAEQEPSDEAKNNLGWLNPNQFSSVPVRARRIMKVEAFYVVMQVKDLHFTPLDSPYLDSMAVQFAFANSDPRASH